jgi:hypothetical protein
MVSVQAEAPVTHAPVALPSAQPIAAPSPPQRHALTPAQIAVLAKPAVVVVRTPQGTGAGFVVAPGKVVTALHVVAGSTVVSVRDRSGAERPVSVVVTYSRADDLALLDTPTITANPLPLADSSEVEVGDSVVAIGHPLGLEGTVTTGVVSAIRRTNETSFLQVSAPISPGSSGGPVLNAFGEVVGLAHGILTEGQALNFATPASRIVRLMRDNAQGFTLEDFAAMTAKPPPPPTPTQPAPTQPAPTQPAPAQAPTPQPRGPSYPEAVAGFSFGSTLRDLFETCPELGVSQSGRDAVCPYQAVRVPFAKGRVSFTLTRGNVTSITIYPTSRREAVVAMVEKYGPPLTALSWKNENWTSAKQWPEGTLGGFQWEANNGSIIRLGKIDRDYFLTFVLREQYDAERGSY